MKKKLSQLFLTLLLGIFFGLAISLPFTQVILSKQNNPYSVIERKYSLEEINEAYHDLETGKDGRGIIDFTI